MFSFSKRKPKPEPRKVYIPEGKKRQILKAYDDFMAAPQGADHLARYDFWALAEDACPELAVADCAWKVAFRNKTAPYFLEA